MPNKKAQIHLFSIITICKNDIENLKKTQKSVLGQALSSFEWIVIDGGSKDGTLEFLKKLRGQGIEWESRPDKGLYDAMNKGLSRAKGDFLIFLNAGDCFASVETLSKVENVLNNNPSPNFLYGDAIVVYPNGREFFEKARSPSYFRYGQPIYHQAFFYNRKVLGSIRFRPEKFRIAADYAFTLECIGQDQKILQVSFPICKFPLGGVSSHNTGLILKEVWAAQRDILGVSFFVRAVSFIIHWVAMVTKEFIPQLYRGIHRIYRKV